MLKLSIIVLFFLLGLSLTQGNLRVKLKQGTLEGTHGKSYNGRTFASFEGIPYTQPPVGDLRFKEPIAASSWNDVLIANKSYICPQIDEIQSVVGSEDCLYMYVYVPKENINRNDNFDVIVHIHGGSLIVGSPFEMVQPEYIMDKDVILVSFNYRLGAAGFLSTGDSLVYGNNGFKDQVLALKWIKNNIKNFGGNPNSITITGFSSGGSSVHFHYLSPLSKGLFNRGWSISYTVLGSASLTLIPLEKTKQLAQNVNCTNVSKKNMIDCLRRKPIEDLVRIADIWFKPVVEKGNTNAFIPDIPYKILKDKKVEDLPWINTNVIDESMSSLDSVFKNRSEIYSICNNFTEWGKSQLDLAEYVDENKMEETLDKIKKFYLNDCKLTEKNGLEKLNRMMTDRHFHVHSDIAVRLQAAATKSPVYSYIFKFIPEDNLVFGGPHVASHGVDNKLVFRFQTNPKKFQPKGEKMMRLLTDLLAEFSRTGIPKLGNCTWTPIDPRKTTLNILEIKSPENIRMREIAELAPTKFWESLPIKENKNLL